MGTSKKESSYVLFLIMALTIFLGLIFSKLGYGAAQPKKIELSTKGDQLLFDKTKLSAKVNQPIKLTFKNGASKSSGLQHNWILVKPGTADEVATASLSVGVDKGWLADSPNVITHTKLLNSGESETVEFNAPSVAGDYPYFCSFPGHAQTMKGVLTIN